MPLKPDGEPYYLSRPNSETERAPGWYIKLGGFKFPVYLGANHVTAEIELIKMVEAKKATHA
jgi:hypothetical protein